jgi:hypothetical protein
MEFIYSLVDFIPHSIRGSVVCLLLIIGGYFLSKIAALLVISLFRALKLVPKSNELLIDNNISRFVFWVCWFGFVILAYSQLPLIASTMPKWPFSLNALVLIFMAALVLLVCENWMRQAWALVADSLNLPKPHGLFKFAERALLYFGCLIFILVGSLTSEQISSTGVRVFVTAFVVGLGFLFANIVKSTVVGVFNQSPDSEPILARFAFHITIAVFLMAASSLWLAPIN